MDSITREADVKVVRRIVGRSGSHLLKRTAAIDKSVTSIANLTRVASAVVVIRVSVRVAKAIGDKARALVASVDTQQTSKGSRSKQANED